MIQNAQQKRGRPKRPRLAPEQIQGAKYLRNILDLLRPLHSHKECPNRQLHYDGYVAYVLLYFFTPVLTSMRGLHEASNFKSIQRKLGLRRFSLGSFSEAGRVFDPALLVPIIDELVERVDTMEGREWLEKLDRTPIAVDGTLLRALPKMVWALWIDEEHRAAKMHLQFHLAKGVPVGAALTHGNGDERAVLGEALRSGVLYVIDRGFCDYGLMADILEEESSFLCRLPNNASYQVLDERPVAEDQRAAGVQRDLIVRLGSASCRALHDRRLRVVEIHVPDDPDAPPRRAKNPDRKTKGYRTDTCEYTLRLATDLLDLDVGLLSLLYRYRWLIELFFRWFKQILRADYLLSESRNGMAIVMYCALIASLLVRLWTGRKPTKRTYEAICFYFLGVIDEDELAAHLKKLQRSECGAARP